MRNELVLGETNERRETINIYCDESCHLKNDRQKSMVLGATWCPKSEVQRISNHIKLLKRAHDISPYFEIKWTKVSPAKIDFYKELVNYFFCENDLHFRGLLIRDKSKLEHEIYGNTHDEFYYKMYYYTLRYTIKPERTHKIFLDIKDTKGGKRTRQLHKALCNTFYDHEKLVISDVQQIRSHESQILQLTDIFIGAISHANRGLSNRSGKGQLINHIKTFQEVQSLENTTSFGRTKFNLFAWEPRNFQK